MEKGVAYLAEVKVAVHPVENSAAQYKGKKYLQCLPDDMFDVHKLLLDMRWLVVFVMYKGSCFFAQ